MDSDHKHFLIERHSKSMNKIANKKIHEETAFCSIQDYAVN